MGQSEAFIRVGNGEDWTFTNARFEDAADHAIQVPQSHRRRDGTGMQGHHYGFLREKDYGDLVARFRFRLGSHSDVGLIFHAADPADFFALHFPESGQANRAQHFWAALSHVQDGWFRIIKMDLVRRVSSTNRLWHEAEVSLSGDHLRAVIDGRGTFEAFDPALPGHGRCGLYLFTSGEVREFHIEGVGCTPRPWDADRRPPQRWFHPSVDTTFGTWQRPGELVQLAETELLHNYTVQERPYSGDVTPVTSRSDDNGQTWTKPERVPDLKVGAWEGWGSIHRFPDGVVRMLIPGEDGFRIGETTDRGRTWLQPRPTGLGAAVLGVNRLYPPPAPFVNVRDGSVLVFAYGGHDSSVPGAAIQTWGSHHCQGFVSRSQDNGTTWSPWKSIDGTLDADSKPVAGNLDLTETCGVETTEGRVLTFTRPIYSPWMWETWSDDGGRTWTPCMRGPFPGYAASNMVRTASGAILVAHRLPGCTIHTSLDDGITWDQGTMIDSAIWCMGSMIEVEPDLVLYVYWDSFESFMRAQFIRVAPRGIAPA